MPDKQTFFESININTDFNEDFYKKVYGYSICDNQFLGDIAKRLTSIGKKEIIISYNEWFKEWNNNYNLEIKKVAAWYSQQDNKHYGSTKKDYRKEENKEWNQKKMELLLKKKQLLLIKKSKQLTKSFMS